MRSSNQEILSNGCLSSAGSSSGSHRHGSGLRPRSPSHAAKNKTPEDRVCEFGWMLTEKNGKLNCRACNLNLDHTRRSTIVEHLRSRKHHRFLEESGFDITAAQAASVSPIVFMEIDDENIVDNTRSSSPVSRPQSPSQSGMTGPYLLKKETHCSSILDELLKDDTFTDVTLTAEGQHLKAHRIILCLSSKYFKDVLSKESATKNIIFFRDIKFEELKNIITFIYTGEVTVDASDLESFMKTAELLEVTSLCEGHKNFPKGFPISQPSEPHRIFKPTGTAKRTISNSSYSPPTKSRKTISGAETTSSPMKSRRKRSQPTALSSFVTIKTEPDVTEGEYFSECESREDQLETSNAFVDVGHLSEEELQPTTPFKDESKSDNEKDSDSLQLNDTPPVSGRCPFCPPSRQLFADATMLTHLQVSHPEETAYPCDVCYTVFTKKLSFLNHHKDCKR